MRDLGQADSLNGPDSVRLSEAELDAMTVEELEAALAIALNSMADKSYDREVISAYLDALERKDPMPEYPDAETSYSRFERKLRSIGLSEALDRPRHPPVRGRRISRKALTVFLAAFLALCLLSAQALGADIFGKLARWTAEVFSFGKVDSDRPESIEGSSEEQVSPIGFPETLPPEYQELWAELEKRDVSSLLFTTYIPDGYTCDGSDLSIFPESDTIDFSAWYVNGSDVIVFNILLSKIVHSTYEKDQKDVEIYEINGIDHYIFSNNSVNVAVWLSDNLEYSLSTTLPIYELKAMLNSMY